MRGLKGKKVLVTGGASGIDQATSARFLEEGCAVCVIDHDVDNRARVAGELPDLTAVIDADVSDTGLQRFFETVHHLTSERRLSRIVYVAEKRAD